MGSRQSTTSSASRVVQAEDNGASYSSTPLRHSRPSESDQMRGDWRQRARSLTAVLTGTDARPPPSSAIDVLQPFSTSPSDIFSMSSSDTEMSASYSLTPHSLPVSLIQYHNFKCPFCSKTVLPDDIECHLVMCITRPPLNYNEDILTEDKGECVICLEEMLKGNKIARLPCLCIYHKLCIDAWFDVNRSCPEHPID